MRLIKLAMTCVIANLVIFASCTDQPPKLPLLGDPVYKQIRTRHGIKTDTIHPVIPHFQFTDQDNKNVSNETFRNKIYIADFFFLSCPTICPKLTANMKHIYDRYAGEKDLLFTSFSIDPKHDTPDLLKTYGQAIGVSSSRWHFLNGDKKAIYQLAIKGFYSPAYPDKENPSNFVHSGGLMLVDQKGHLRGVYDGTSDEETGQLIKDIKILIEEKVTGRLRNSIDR